MSGMHVKVLNSGSVSLISSMGDDLDVINSARVSFSSSQHSMDEKGIGLINFLLKNKHATPFEHVVFKFHIKAPIFVAREWFRHRWSSFNEMSMRYHIPDTIDFFYPSEDAVRKQVGKPGNYSFQKFNDPAVFDFVCEAFESVYRQAESSYYEMIEAGIAKEIARSVLPVGQYTEFIWTVNLRSLLNFLSLRNDSNAQHEIREYAKVIERIANTIVPVCMDSFVENGRMAL